MDKGVNMSYLDNLKSNLDVKHTMVEGDFKFPQDTYVVYVDGSYNTERKIAGWGFVVVVNDQMVFLDNGNVDDEEFKSRNITGECASAVRAIDWLESIGAKNAVIVHDYIGLGKWGINNWKAKSAIATTYKKYFEGLNLSLIFRWVKGHSNNEWNDFADVLAELGKLKTTEEF